ncbi:MAG: hypothetical protein LAO77_23230 [Acidobacteriia bacterium]|nr:hypothetical protein [Terriglobia bacterium]
MTSEPGKGAITRAWVLSAAGIVLYLWTIWVPQLLYVVIPRFLGIGPPAGRIGDILFIASLRYYDVYLFPPWMFPCGFYNEPSLPWMCSLDLPALIVVSLLTYFVYRRSRAASVLLLIAYVLSKALVFIRLDPGSIVLWVHPRAFGPVRFLWQVVTGVWGYVFFQGARETLAVPRGGSGGRGDPLPRG